MDVNKSFEIYSHLPIILQNVACSIAGIKMRRERYNSTFIHALSFLKKTESWTLDKLQNYQNENLQTLIQHAYETVPYYHEIFEKANLIPKDIQTIEDLDKIPILTKQIIRERWKDLQSKSIPNSLRAYGNTGGTTGTALKIAYEKKTLAWQWAIWWRHRGRFGIEINDSFIVFAGRNVVPLNNLKPPFWRHNIPMNQTYVSIHHLTKENLPVLADYLRKRNVKYYSGYPSALYTVASYFKENNIFLRYPPVITFTGAETLLPHQRQVIEESFSTTVSDQYGASEYCGNISECEMFKYHVDMEFGIIEFLPIPKLHSNIRQIICTGLKNLAMPLIRYDIGDLATIKPEKCNCGRESQIVEKIDGRIESYIITPDGRQLGRLDFLFKKSTNIEEAQLIQNELSRITFKIVKNNNYNYEDEQLLIKNIHSYMGDSFEIDLQYVNSISRERNGKFRQIISTVFVDKFKSTIQ